VTAELNVFSFRGNAVSDEADVMSSGRLSHSCEPAAGHDRSLIVARRDGQRVNWLKADDRSDSWEGMSSPRLSRSHRYRRAVPWRSPYTMAISTSINKIFAVGMGYLSL